MRLWAGASVGNISARCVVQRRVRNGGADLQARLAGAAHPVDTRAEEGGPAVLHDAPDLPPSRVDAAQECAVVDAEAIAGVILLRERSVKRRGSPLRGRGARGEGRRAGDECRCAAAWREARAMQGLAHIDVAEPGDDALVRQRGLERCLASAKRSGQRTRSNDARRFGPSGPNTGPLVTSPEQTHDAKASGVVEDATALPEDIWKMTDRACRAQRPDPWTPQTFPTSEDA